ncbi:MAG: hypothetical protein COV52_03060 [Gammaproteobacteria bacterium CG11_big_fil_rev_8_21_14_0_20_46_22]|nr:MAG: hypothetical protein COW05_06010 [Gammaproteobacteria bacterium CG12_big_fil_rev_8_21_14_0_65_46_12]PIR11611.1 MAG: hypothetical protein COV52_03060 [Gammaproteobacteria bacterium CG11_big_fil_rev_8_21_14_0_20_46_22]
MHAHARKQQSQSHRHVVALHSDPAVLRFARDFCESQNIGGCSQGFLAKNPNYFCNKSFSHLTLFSHGSEEQFGEERYSPEDLVKYLEAIGFLRVEKKDKQLTVDLVACGVGMTRSGESYLTRFSQALLAKGYSKVSVRGLTTRATYLSFGGVEAYQMRIERARIGCGLKIIARRVDKSDEYAVMQESFRQRNLAIANGDRPSVYDIDKKLGARFPFRTLAQYSDLESALSRPYNVIHPNDLRSKKSPWEQALESEQYYLDEQAHRFNKSTQALIDQFKQQCASSKTKDELKATISQTYEASKKILHRVRLEVLCSMDALLDAKALALLLIAQHIQTLGDEMQKGKRSSLRLVKRERLEGLKNQLTGPTQSAESKSALVLSALQDTTLNKRYLPGESRTTRLLKRIQTRLAKEPASANPSSPSCS